MLHTVIGLVLQVGDAKFPQAFGFRSRVLTPYFTATEECGGDKRLVQLELVCEADGVALPDPL